MKQSLFLPSELDFTLVKFNNTATNIDFEMCSYQISSYCPLCHTISTKIHSRYVRMIGDLPVSGKIAKLKLQVRKFFCENLDCCRKILPNDLKNNSFHVGGRLTEHPQLFYKKIPDIFKGSTDFFLIIGKPM